MVMYTLLYLKWITNKDLLYGTGNLLGVIWQLGWEWVWGRMETCICTAESLHCSSETTTALSIGYTPIQNKKLKKKKKEEEALTDSDYWSQNSAERAQLT